MEYAVRMALKGHYNLHVDSIDGVLRSITPAYGCGDALWKIEEYRDELAPSLYPDYYDYVDKLDSKSGFKAKLKDILSPSFYGIVSLYKSVLTDNEIAALSTILSLSYKEDLIKWEMLGSQLLSMSQAQNIKDVTSDTSKKRRFNNSLNDSPDISIKSMLTRRFNNKIKLKNELKHIT